jgi:RNA polymerase sigma-70 factor (ECF subfamily)
LVTLHTKFEDLLRAYQQPLTTYLCNLLNDEEYGKELAQETFWRAYRALARGQQITCHKAWLYRIATNVANDHFRRARLLRWLPIHEIEQHPALCEGDSTDCVADQLIVREALAQLSPDYRVPLVLHLCDGLTTAEIAEVLDLSQGAVKMRLSRAREKFRHLIQNGSDSTEGHQR